MNTYRTLVACLVLTAACGVDRLQHADMPDSGVTTSGDGGASDAGVVVDAGQPVDAGAADAGVDAGLVAFDAGVDAGLDAGPAVVDAGADAGTDAGTTVDAGSGDETDAGTPCTPSGISPQLRAVPGGPYQNCQGGVIPRTDVQLDTQPWSGCCGELVRICAVTGFSTQNALYCR
ncbi:MAG: hypothetical protein JNM69_23165 [Archangium sp.]|nr:hypothetical protein [Archangium sp.]